MIKLQNSSFVLAFSSYATPCPSVFQYQLSSSGEWHGIISVPNPYPVVAIDIRVEMYAAGTLPLVIQLYNFLIFLRLA
jgi:hypothetical protein